MKYLKSELLLFTAVLLVITISCLTTISSVLYYNSSISQSEENSSNLAAAYKQSISNAMNSFRIQIKMLASESFLTNKKISRQEQENLLNEEAKNIGFLHLGTADAQGDISSGTSIADQTFFKEARNGVTYISDPAKNSTGQLTLFIGTPITGSDKILYGEFSYDTLSKTVNQIKIGESGYAFVINKNGATVIHPNETNVEKPMDYFKLAKKDASYQPTANIFSQMISGKTGTGFSYYNGVRRLVGYTTLGVPEGWSVAVTTPVTQVTENLFHTLEFCIGSGILILLAAILITRVFAKKITQPIVTATRRIELLEQGNLQEEMETVSGRDEGARLAIALQNTVHSLRAYISDISRILTAIAEKDLTVKSSVEYVGDFVSIQHALSHILQSLNTTFSGIRQATVQVRSDSEQVALGAQNLAENSTEQASTVEHLTNSLTEVSRHISDNAESASRMEMLSEEAIKYVDKGDNQMQQMLDSMNRIDSSSKKILKIIKVINDIAFQTNILALNASVEAAHAGEAGKGFSVVAEEVRGLASKSAQAAKSSTELVGESIESVSHGMTIANQTAEALHVIVLKVGNVNELVSKIAEASQKQSQNVIELNNGMNQISTVTQTNSATAEESAATSEELFSQSQLLERLVTDFKTETEQSPASDLVLLESESAVNEY